MDVDSQLDPCCSSEEGLVSSGKVERHRMNTKVRCAGAAVVCMLVASCLAWTSRGGGVSTSSNDIVSLSHTEIDLHPDACVVATGPLSKIVHIIEARQIRLEGHILQQELETAKAIIENKHSPKLLEGIEDVLDDATWQDYVDAEVIIKEEDMEAITRCMLGNPNISMSEHAETPSGSTTATRVLDRTVRHWPNGRVRYEFHHSCGEKCKKAIAGAISEITQQVPCVTFTKTRSDHHILVKADEDGCWATLGYTGRRRGQQKLNLGNGCKIKGIAIHELFHSLGMRHEHVRPDRDHYVTVHWNNIQSDYWKTWYKTVPTMSTKEPYDYLSIMHYSLNDQMQPKNPKVKKYVGQKMLASEIDVRVVCGEYGCSSRCKPNVKNAYLTRNLAPSDAAGKGFAPRTRNECYCKTNWQYSGRRRYSKCANSQNKGCCNPDGYSGGNWCETTSRCKGSWWDYCTPPPIAPKTVLGCTCKRYWKRNGKTSSSSSGHCFNPTNWAGGPYCLVEKGSCPGYPNRWYDNCVPKQR